MRNRLMGSALAVLVVTLAGGSASYAADTFALDAAHTAVTFKISHLGLSWTHGRFDAVSGSFTIDGDKSSFELAIKATSIDTGNTGRDDHLRGPDFLNVKQFAGITFKSTSVKTIDGGLEVTGDFTMHGVTKSISFPLKGGKTAEFPPGTVRTGYTTELTLKRSDFGMDKLKEAVGDEVHIGISFEGTKKK